MKNLQIFIAQHLSLKRNRIHNPSSIKYTEKIVFINNLAKRTATFS